MKITKKILENIIREETAKVLAEDRTSSREHWMDGGLENGISAAETAAHQLGGQGSSIMRAKLELSAAAQWFDWMERLGIDPKEEGSLRGEESPQERYRHYSEMYTTALKVLSDRAQALDLVGRLNQPEDPTQSVDFVKKTLQERDYTVPKAGWFDDKAPGKEFERLVSYVEHYRKYAVEEIERLRATVKGLSGRIQALELKNKEF